MTDLISAVLAYRDEWAAAEAGAADYALRAAKREEMFAAAELAATVIEGLADGKTLASLDFTFEVHPPVGTCGTCEHWQKPSEIGGAAEVFGRCTRIPSVDEKDYSMSDEQWAKNVDTTAYTSDASGYSSSLNTLPDYGCTLYLPFDVTK